MLQKNVSILFSCKGDKAGSTVQILCHVASDQRDPRQQSDFSQSVLWQVFSISTNLDLCLYIKLYHALLCSFFLRWEKILCTENKKWGTGRSSTFLHCYLCKALCVLDALSCVVSVKTDGASYMKSSLQTNFCVTDIFCHLVVGYFFSNDKATCLWGEKRQQQTKQPKKPTKVVSLPFLTLTRS